MEELFYGKKKAENMPSTPPPPSACDAEKKDYVLRELSKVYASVFRPVEEATKFDVFYSSLLNEAEFRTPPMVLLIGPYSVGKTTFIEYLLGKSFPGPPDAIDTPGVLSGEKQRVARNYDFDVVVQWFAERVDLIILLFDPFKLDISDELMSVIKGFKGHEDKVRVVLNKADSVSQQQLMRVYGALMWSLGKVLNTPEMPSVYGFDKKKKELLDTMPAQFRTIDFTEFPKIAGGRLRKGKAMTDLDHALNVTIPGLMEFLPRGRRDDDPKPEAEPVADAEPVAAPEAVVLETVAKS
ncbi:hypothetical protein JL720_16303 [Aureococcus anophagefferens]|nr:hypothetical protein JL720_16303 [Aureococcus anophagefferens]